MQRKFVRTLQNVSFLCKGSNIKELIEIDMNL